MVRTRTVELTDSELEDLIDALEKTINEWYGVSPDEKIQRWESLLQDLKEAKFDDKG
jgi:hypothetical protein